MTALESVLHVLKFMSKRSQFIVETKIPDLKSYYLNRPLYESAYERCKGSAFLVCFMNEGIDEEKKAVLLTCFEDENSVKKFHELVTKKEEVWSEEHKADQVVDSILTSMGSLD